MFIKLNILYKGNFEASFNLQHERTTVYVQCFNQLQFTCNISAGVGVLHVSGSADSGRHTVF